MTGKIKIKAGSFNGFASINGSSAGNGNGGDVTSGQTGSKNRSSSKTAPARLEGFEDENDDDNALFKVVMNCLMEARFFSSVDGGVDLMRT